MSEYRRLISYMYEYEGNEKGKNVGFVKLEARNGQCRLNVNVKRMYVGGNAIGVYLLSKTGEKILLGNMFVRGGGGEFQSTVDAKNVEGSGIGLDGCYGLTVHDVKNAWRSYKTVWEDAAVPVRSEESDGTEQNVTLSAENDSAAGPLAQEILPGSDEITGARDSMDLVQEIDEEIARSAELQTVESLQAAGVSRTEEKLQAAEEFRTEGKLYAEREIQELENPELLRYLQETETAEPDPEQLWKELRSTYPKIQPFDYDGGSEVLTIRPQDIGKLPRENWIYGNNSFLLHGYYNFRYLILVRLEHGEGKTRYLIGIPGHYYSNEKYMATMFGFPNFVLSKKQPPNDGRFGYWYTDIKMR